MEAEKRQKMKIAAQQGGTAKTTVIGEFQVKLWPISRI